MRLFGNKRIEELEETIKNLRRQICETLKVETELRKRRDRAEETVTDLHAAIGKFLGVAVTSDILKKVPEEGEFGRAFLELCDAFNYSHKRME